MAFYADKKNVQVSNRLQQYDEIRLPGEKPPSPGIYKCQGCGYEDVINRECGKLPPCSSCNGDDGWKLLVKAVDK